MVKIAITAVLGISVLAIILNSNGESKSSTDRIKKPTLDREIVENRDLKKVKLSPFIKVDSVGKAPENKNYELYEKLKILNEPKMKLTKDNREEYIEYKKKSMNAIFLSEERNEEWASQAEADLTHFFEEAVAELEVGLYDTLVGSFNNMPEDVKNKLLKVSPDFDPGKVNLTIKNLECRSTGCRYDLDFGLGDSKVAQIFTKELSSLFQSWVDNSFGKTQKGKPKGVWFKDEPTRIYFATTKRGEETWGR